MCACVVFCRASVFCLPGFGTNSPKVRGGSPGCRSPPPSISFPGNPTTKNDMEVHIMTIINLRDFYYWYTQDEYIEVTDDVAEALRASVRYEAAYQRRLSRHKAQYSLDCEDGIEYSACLRELTPDEVLELKERFCRLWNALNSLPPAQGRRVDACIILGKSFSEVALAEGVDESAVRRAVERGLENMKKFLKNSR